MKTFLSFWLTYFDPSGPTDDETVESYGFINGLIEEEGNRYLQMVQSNVFFLVIALYAFKMKLVQYQVLYEEETFLQKKKHLKCISTLFFTF